MILKVTEIINSVSADDVAKGNLVYETILATTDAEIVLDFAGVDLVNTAFLNNAIGKLFNIREYNLSEKPVEVRNMTQSMLDLLMESVRVAREMYR